MGRNRKNGLDYFPLDTDFFQDIKIRKLIKRQGGEAITVYTYILSLIYRQGYYMEWDDELPFIVSETTGFDEDRIAETINCCIDVGLFSKTLFDTDRILTSKGIQERYRKACYSCKRKCDIQEFSLIFSSEETPISSEEKRINSEEKPFPPKKSRLIRKNSEKSTQIKEKETKVNKKTSTDVDEKKEEKEKIPTPTPPTEDFLSQITDDAEWRKSIAAAFKIYGDTIDEYLEAFRLHCQVSAKRHTDLADAKSHFASWLNIQLRKSDEQRQTDQRTQRIQQEEQRRTEAAQSLREENERIYQEEQRKRDSEQKTRQEMFSGKSSIELYQETLLRAKAGDPGAQAQLPEYLWQDPPPL